MLWVALAVGATLAAVAAALVLTGEGRFWLRGIKAEVELRRMMAALPGVERRAGERVAMPDGVRLATDLYLPVGGGARPAILVRTPYGRTRNHEARSWVRLFAPQGYAVLVQDMRGRHGSEGVFAPWPNAGPDGAATLDWIAAQPWSDGTVGTVGCSAMGESQLPLAALRHPAHRAMIALGAGGAAGSVEGLYNAFGMFEGGVPTLSAGFGWFTQSGGKTPDRMAPVAVDHASGLRTVPLRDAVRRFRSDPTDWPDQLDHFTDPAWNRANGYVTGDEVYATPALIGDTWFDHSVHASFALWRQFLRSGVEAHVLIGPGSHCDFTGPFREGAVGDYPVAPDPEYSPDATYLAFMDHYLRGAPLPALPPVRVYQLGSDRWQDLTEWPPAQTATFEVPIMGEALGAGADLPLAPIERQFRADPAAPVPALGGALCCTGNPDDRAGPLDQRAIEQRPDLLVYESPPLAEDLVLAGPLAARISLSADVPDLDLIVRLTEVFPDGRSITVQEGALRLRFRDGFTTPRLLDPDEIAVAEVRLRDTNRVIRAGHRLRLHLAGSSFPLLARNMQGGGVPQDETEPRPGIVRVHAGQELSSVLIVQSAAAPVFEQTGAPGGAPEGAPDLSPPQSPG